MKPPEYLTIGHVTKDITTSGSQLGGTVSFAGRAAVALDARVGILTSAHPTYDLTQLTREITVKRIDARETTTFNNEYTDHGRIQTLHARAALLKPKHLPPNWLGAPVVHLAPVADEVDPSFIDTLTGRVVGLTPQGWLRGWDDNGRIRPKPWPDAEIYLPRATVVILSEEDLPDSDMLTQYRQWSRLLILTTGASGCIVFTPTESRHVAAPRVSEMEPTGAGDIFATAFLLAYRRNGRDPFAAAHFANIVAAHSVTKIGLPAKINEIKQTLRRQQAADPKSNQKKLTRR